MKKRTAFIGAILSLISFGQPLLIKTGIALVTSGLMLSVPKKANAESATFYFERGIKKQLEQNYQDAIEDFTKSIKLNPKYFEAYFNRGFSKSALDNIQDAIGDLTKAI